MLAWYVVISLWKQLRSTLLLERCKIWATDAARHWKTTGTISQRTLMEERVWIIQRGQWIFFGPRQTRHRPVSIITVAIGPRKWARTYLRLKLTARIELRKESHTCLLKQGICHSFRVKNRGCSALTTQWPRRKAKVRQVYYLEQATPSCITKIEIICSEHQAMVPIRLRPLFQRWVKVTQAG